MVWTACQDLETGKGRGLAEINHCIRSINCFT